MTVATSVPTSTEPFAATVFDTAHAVLRAGLVLLLSASATTTVLAATGELGARVVAEGVVFTALAVAAVVRVEDTARLLRPAGRTTLLAAVFAAVGLLDTSVQSNYAQIGSAIVFVAAVLDSRRWLLACLAVSVLGYLLGIWAGHSTSWLLHGEGPGLLATQAGGLAMSGGGGLLAITILRRFIAAAPLELAEVRDGAPSLTPELAAAVRGTPVLERADPAALVSPLSAAESEVCARLCAGRAPKQIAQELGVALATVRSHIAAAKRKTGARTVGQLAAIFAEGTRGG